VREQPRGKIHINEQPIPKVARRDTPQIKNEQPKPRKYSQERRRSSIVPFERRSFRKMALAPIGVNSTAMVSAGERRRNLGLARQDAVTGMNTQSRIEHGLLTKQNSAPNGSQVATARLIGRQGSRTRRQTFNSDSGNSSVSLLSTLDERRRQYSRTSNTRVSRTSQISNDSGFYNMRISRESNHNPSALRLAMRRSSSKCDLRKSANNYQLVSETDNMISVGPFQFVKK